MIILTFFCLLIYNIYSIISITESRKYMSYSTMRVKIR